MAGIGYPGSNPAALCCSIFVYIFWILLIKVWTNDIFTSMTRNSWLIGGAVLLAGLWATKQVVRAAYEQPQYKVTEKLEKFEVRDYQPYLIASVKVSEQEMESAMSSAFMRLAGYIFGKNESQKRIAMTSPVEFQVDSQTMTFMIPSKYKLQDLPDPSDEGIVLKQQPGRLMAALRFTGYIDESLWQNKKALLLEAVQASSYEAVGDPIFFGYDPPAVPGALRRNEVLVEVRPQKS